MMRFHSQFSRFQIVQTLEAIRFAAAAGKENRKIEPETYAHVIDFYSRTKTAIIPRFNRAYSTPQVRISSATESILIHSSDIVTHVADTETRRARA